MITRSSSSTQALYSVPSHSRRLRDLLVRAGLSQRAAAAELGIGERTMRHYCAGDEPVPRVVMLALERLVDMQRELENGQP